MIRQLSLRHLAPLALASTALLSCGQSPMGAGNSEFALEVIWLGTQPTGATLASFDATMNEVRAIITGGLPDATIPSDFTNLNQCGLAGQPDIVRSSIAGLRVYLVVEPIDGSGGNLGQAGPCLVRNSNIPALGYMRFDEADVANLQASGRLTRVVLHEMMHVLGVGTVWFDNFVDTLATPSDVRYTGALARAACANANGGSAQCASSIPVHSTDGPGSRFSHWRESVFQSELMTPFLGAGPAPFSAMSIQALSDLGYDVNPSRADAYTVPLPPVAAALRDGPATSDIVLPEPVTPRWKIDGAGRLSPYRPRR